MFSGLLKLPQIYNIVSSGNVVGISGSAVYRLANCPMCSQGIRCCRRVHHVSEIYMACIAGGWVVRAVCGGAALFRFIRVLGHAGVRLVAGFSFQHVRSVAI